MTLRESDYTETCPECDGWEIRFANEFYNKEEKRTEFTVICRACGFEWSDWEDDS